ncbi:hypothetical protein [Rhodococcus sp. JS3073]|nr:hypothetical protein [Rhodococcus sp. JS3073]WAM19514.1 hypothetical protein OYT95_38195 [Rhodococcus sp. JS3073]
MPTIRPQMTVVHRPSPPRVFTVLDRARTDSAAGRGGVVYRG